MPLYRCPQNVKLIKMYIAAVFHLWQSNQAQNQSRLTLYVSLKSFARCHHQANQKNLPVFLCLPHGHREKRHQQKPSAVTGAALAVSVVFNNHWLELSFCWGQAAHLFLPAAPSPGICSSLQRARVSQCLTQWTQERVWWDAGTFLHCDTLLQICSSSSSQELGFFFFIYLFFFFWVLSQVLGVSAFFQSIRRWILLKAGYCHHWTFESGMTNSAWCKSKLHWGRE